MTVQSSCQLTYRDCLDDVTSGVYELLVQLFDETRMFYDNFRYEAASLEVTSSLKLEQVALGNDDRLIVIQSLQ